MNSAIDEYIISKYEIKRRINAFTTFIISLILSLIILSVLLALFCWINAIFIILIGLILIISRYLLVKFFNTFLKMKIVLSDHYVERIGSEQNEKLLLKDIRQIHILKTSRDTIRDIKIILTDKKCFVLNALENSEQFKKELVQKCENAAIREYHEPIDYDHPLFYVVLGFIVSFFAVIAMSLIVQIDYNALKYFYFIIAFYTFIMGIYFIFAKPLSKYYGKKTQITDYILGLFMVSIGIGIYMLGK